LGALSGHPHGWQTRLGGGGVSQGPGIRTTYFVVEPNRDQLREICRLADAGELRPAIDSVFPLVEAQTAFARCQERGKRGKVVIHVSEEMTDA
jgi:NADPH:quinone reductase-like Zn-dependent oxidoreductase